MEDEAIDGQEALDVSTDNLEPVEIEETISETELSPREQKLQDLAEKALDAPEEEAARPDLVAPEEEPLPDSPLILDDDGNWVATIKVNGQEVERTYEQLIAQSQKHESADVRLQEAAEKQRQLEEYEQLLRNEEARIKAQSNPQLSEQDAESTNSDDVKAFLEQIYDGNTEDAAEQLAKLLEGRQQPTLDVEAITRQSTEQAIIEINKVNQEREYQNSLQAGMKWLETEHSDLMADDMMKEFVNSQTTVVMNGNPSMTPEQVIKQATADVLSKLGNAKQSDRGSVKSTLKQQPTRQSGSAYIPPTKQTVDNSPASAIAAMKASRNAIAGRPV